MLSGKHLCFAQNVTLPGLARFKMSAEEKNEIASCDANKQNAQNSLQTLNKQNDQKKIFKHEMQCKKTKMSKKNMKKCDVNKKNFQARKT